MIQKTVQVVSYRTKLERSAVLIGIEQRKFLNPDT